MSSMLSILHCVSVAGATFVWVGPVLWWVTPKNIVFLSDSQFGLSCRNVLLTMEMQRKTKNIDDIYFQTFWVKRIVFQIKKSK